MDGVISICHETESCTRLRGHDGPCRLSLTLRSMGPVEVMRDLARRLDAGAPPRGVAVALRAAATRLAGEE